MLSSYEVLNSESFLLCEARYSFQRCSAELEFGLRSGAAQLTERAPDAEFRTA